MDFVGLPVRTSAHSAERVRFRTFTDAYEHFSGRVLLLGGRGSGQTTTLRAFARHAIAACIEDRSLPLPVLGTVSSWPPQQSPSIPDWIATLQEEPYRGMVRDAVRANRALLLLDGLDELGAVVIVRDGD